MIVPHDLVRLNALLRERGVDLGKKIHFLSETTSTNDEAKRAAKDAAHGELWIAETQTKGRGRQGRAWVSSAGENLLFSVLLRLPGPKTNHPLLALASGLAVRDAIARACPQRTVEIKWPNDVLVGTKKISGILVESANGAIVVGIGINVHARSFPEDIVATSVSLESGEADRAKILVDVLEGLDRDAPIVLARGLGLVHARIASADALKGEHVSFEDGPSGIADGIDLEGRLMVRTETGIAHVASGEATVSRSRTRR